MPTTKLNELVPVLQAAIAPVILISGVGLLLLSLTNRFGRAVDRSRKILQHMQGAAVGERERLASQVKILHRRAELIQTAIICAAVSVLLAASMMIMLFLMTWLKLEFGLIISLLFIGCLTALILSIVAFIAEVRMSLTALRLELGI